MAAETDASQIRRLRQRGAARLLRNANSPAGIALIGFLLTGVFGAIIADQIKGGDDSRAAYAQVLSERNARLSRIRDLIDVALAKRAAYISLIMADIDREGAAKDIDLTWPAYRQTIIDGSVTVRQSKMDIERELEFDKSNEGVTFTNYLNEYIMPSLADENDCLSAARDDYTNLELNVVDRKERASAALSACKKPSWETLDNCIGDFTTNLDYAIRIREQVRNDEESWFERVVHHIPLYCNINRDALCRQQDFKERLSGTLKTNCGPEPNVS